MIIYHGSNHIIENPEYGAGRPYNDYGLGFYCTESPDMAREWSVHPGVLRGYVNEYSIDLGGLDVLDLNSSSYGLLDWLAVLLENRSFSVDTQLEETARAYLIEKFAVDYKDRDVIRGYRADDSYFSFAKAFLGGGISYEQLGRAMRLGKLGEQIVIKSPHAFGLLQFEGAEEVSVDEWFPRRQKRDAKARRQYRAEARSGFDPDGLYIQEILREQMGPGDARLQ